MRKGYGLLLLVLVAVLSAGGCRLVIGFEDAVLEDAGAGGRGGSGSTGSTGGATASCSDGVKNGSESGKDCGGSCSPCPDGSGCQVGPDCESKVCVGGSCIAAACDDKVKNADESDVDCGGSCPACGPGRLCGGDPDCKNGQCMAGACLSTCTDALKGGKETDVDCGGGIVSTCPACANGKACTIGSDCQSGVCDASLCLDYHVWSKGFGISAATRTSGAFVDSGGNTMLVGTFDGSVDFGGGLLMTKGGTDIFVARFDSDGNPLWSKRFGDAQDQDTTAASLDGDGNVLVTGRFDGSLDIGTVSYSMNTDVFVAKVDPSGLGDWNNKFVGTGFNFSEGIASDSGGNVVVMGVFSGSVSCGGASLPSQGGRDIYIVKLNPSGGHIWSKRFGGAQDESAYGIVADGAGNLILTGSSTGIVNFGGGPLAGNGSFVVKLSPLGEHIWSKGLPNAYGEAVAVDGSGNVVVAGSLTGTVDFGGGAISGSEFSLKLDPGGNHLWSKGFVGASVSKIACDNAGNILMTGSFVGTTDLGGGTLVSAGGLDVFLVKLDGGGKHVWSRGFGEISDESGNSLAVYDSKTLLVAGGFGVNISLGGVPLANSGTDNVFLAKLRTP